MKEALYIDHNTFGYQLCSIMTRLSDSSGHIMVRSRTWWLSWGLYHCWNKANGLPTLAHGSGKGPSFWCFCSYFHHFDWLCEQCNPNSAVLWRELSTGLAGECAISEMSLKKIEQCSKLAPCVLLAISGFRSPCTWRWSWGVFDYSVERSQVDWPAW